ncbi:hypothetical protein [Corallincola luteus]|uniref:hypothetical protein n=1 Tax=Corallincola luteus TaxID=1775177 RepID=UPI001F1002D7
MNNPLNATDPSGYIFQMLAVWAIQYAVANTAIASFVSAVSTVYSMFSLAQGIGQVVAGISQAYSAWTDGAGGAVLGKAITGAAKFAAMTLVNMYIVAPMKERHLSSWDLGRLIYLRTRIR